MMDIDFAQKDYSSILYLFFCSHAISWSLWPQSIQRLNSSGKDASSGLLLQGGLAGPEV